jgi:hypothetical protein
MKGENEPVAFSSFVLQPSSFRIHRVSPGEYGLTSSDGNPGTNGATSKLAAERPIKTKLAGLQVAICRPSRWVSLGAVGDVVESAVLSG